MSSTTKTRRTVIQAIGVGSVAALAGCLGGGDDPADETDTEDTNSNEFHIDAGETIVLEGHVAHWKGVEPAPLEDAENPTLILEEGAEYTLEWVNGDGIMHDFVISDGDGELESTDTETEEGEGHTFDFTASADMVEYYCSLHSATQSGDIRVE